MGRTGLSRRRFCSAAVATGLSVGVLRAPMAAASQLGGRPFSDPAIITPMPEDWRSRPIHREPGYDLALAIDQQLFPAVRPLVLDFAAKRNIKVGLQEGTCGIASGALQARMADVTGMCCPPGPLDRFPDVRYHTIGIAAVALIAHPANPLNDIDLAQARRFFGQEGTSWSDLPPSAIATGGEVRAVTRLHCVERPGHWRLLLDTPDDFAADVIEVPTIVDMISTVSRNTQAIGYETLWHVEAQAGRGRVKVLRLGGYHPADGAAVAAGKYPLYRVFNVTSWTASPAATSIAQDLVDHLVANAGAIQPVFGIVPALRLCDAGWRFRGDEVIAEPG